MAATATAPTPKTHLGEFRQVPIEDLVTWPNNPRKHYNTTDDAELAENVRVHGVIEPLIARPTLEKDVFEIIAGERRYRAAKSVGIVRLPVLVRELDDAQAIEFALAENGHRNNLHPLDEAAAFAELQRINPGVNTVEHLAAQHGRSVRHVKDSLALLQLEPEVRKAFEDGGITVTHARKIARLEKAVQAKALEACFDRQFDHETGKSKDVLAPVSTLEAWVRETVRLSLTSTEAQEEFPELVAEVTSAEATGATVTMLSDKWVSYGQKPKDGDPLDREKWEECKPKDKGAQIGVIVEGRRRGKKVHFRLKSVARAEARQTSPSSSGQKTPEMREQERKAREIEQQRRAEQAAKEQRRDEVGERAIIAAATKVKAFGPDALRVVASCLGGCDALTMEQSVAISKAIGVPHGTWTSVNNADALKKLSTRNLLRAIVVLVLSHDGIYHGDFDRACKAFGVDVKKIDAEVAKAAAAAAKATPKKAAKKGKAKAA